MTTVRTSLVMVLASAVLMVGVSPASAIVNGEPTGDRYPNVVGIAGRFPDGTWWDGVGSAQLIAPDVVLTAAHTFDFYRSVGIDSFYVTPDPVWRPGTSRVIAAKRVVVDPDYPNTYESDLAVVILSSPIRGVTPVQLPEENLLDRMKAAGTLGELVAVGYGCQVLLKPDTGQTCDGTTRRVATERVNALNPASLLIQANSSATGGGGTCFGDSGGPHFIPGTNISVGLTKEINASECRTVSWPIRLDLPDVRAFLGRFVPLP